MSQTVYTKRLRVAALRQEVFASPDAGTPEQMDALIAAEQDLQSAETRPASAPQIGLLLDNKTDSGLLGPDTTGLAALVTLGMAQVPTSIYHLLDAEKTPLVVCTVKNVPITHEKPRTRRVRVSSHIEGYSAQSNDTLELQSGDDATFNQLPTLFPAAVRDLTELTRATLHIQVDDLDGKIEIHKTHPLWLLARTTAPVRVRDPATPGAWKDLSGYFGAYVTPNAPLVREFVGIVARAHPDGVLSGYLGGTALKVRAQVAAMYNALKENQISYVHSALQFSPEAGGTNQRVRLPRESLHDKQANCIDMCVLFASLLEAITLHPILVIVPGHAIVGWRENDGDGAWRYVETTRMKTDEFDMACAIGERIASKYQAAAAEGVLPDGETATNNSFFRAWPLQELREKYNIFPME